MGPNNGLLNDRLYELSAGAAEGLIVPSHLDFGAAGATDFVERFEAKLGPMQDILTTFGYDVVYLLREALLAADDPDDRASVKAALSEIGSFCGISSCFEHDLAGNYLTGELFHLVMTPDGFEPYTPTAPAADPQAAARAACVAEAAALAEAAKAPITPVLPSTPVDTSVNVGKTVWYISGTFRDERSKQIAGAFEDAGTAAGLNVRVIDGEGDVQNWNQLIEQGIAANIDGIHIQGIDPDLVSTSVQEADDAGIPVTMGSALPSPWSELLHGTEINVSGDMKADSKVVVDYILANSDCQGTIIMLATTLFSLGVAGIEGVEEELARLCPDDCKLVVEEVDFSNLSGSVPPQTVALAQRFPEAVWMIPQFDVLALPMLLGLEDAGISDRIKMIGHDGAFANLELVRGGESPQVADMAWSPAPVQGYRMPSRSR